MSSNYPDGALEDRRAPFNQSDEDPMLTCTRCEWQGTSLEDDCPDCGSMIVEMEE